MSIPEEDIKKLFNFIKHLKRNDGHAFWCTFSMSECAGPEGDYCNCQDFKEAIRIIRKNE
jgi:hypothetical protein